MNQIITNPKGIPWCKQWIINEDIPNGQRIQTPWPRILDIEGPRKTNVQINTYNPDQTIFIQKEWFSRYKFQQQGLHGAEFSLASSY